jgi:hypothetical protein
VAKPNLASLSLGAVLAVPALVFAQASVVPGRGGIARRLAAVEAAVASLREENRALRARVSSLPASLATLEATVQTIDDRKVMALEPFLAVTQDERGPLVRLAGANLQIVNGWALPERSTAWAT